jgi:hypothetical protein
MNSLEAAARNYVANVTGAPPLVINYIFDNNYLNIAEMARAAAGQMITGAYATLVPIDDSVGAYDEGYVDALNETIDHIDGLVIGVPCECAASSVHTTLEQLKADVRGRIEEVTTPEAAPATSLFDQIFGFGEQAEG